MKICKQCGSELESGQKFCPNCGARVPEDNIGIQMGDANAISAQNVVGGNLEIVNGNKEVINGNKITAENYTVNNITNEAGFAQNTVNISQLCSRAIEYYEDENYFKALSIFREIADQDLEALYYIALCTRDGNGTKKDYKKAAALLEKAASGGYVEAQKELACMLISDKYGMKNIPEAIKCLTKVADTGDNFALLNLGEIYLSGYGVDKDEQRALEFLEKVEQGYSQIVRMALGNIYFDGLAIKQDVEKAYNYYKSCEGENFDSDEKYVYEIEIYCQGCLNYAEILTRNIKGFGNYDLGVEYYNYIIRRFDLDEARQKLAELEADKPPYKIIVDRRIGKCAMDSYGVLFNEDITILLGVDDNEWDNDCEEYTIPDTVKIIDEDAFWCRKFTSVIIPDSVTELRGRAFLHCEHLHSLVIPKSVTKIGECCFQECYELEEIKLNGNIDKIENATFDDCRELSSIIIPNSVTSIGKNAFNNCI